MCRAVESPLDQSFGGIDPATTRGWNGAQGLDLRLITHRVIRVDQAMEGWAWGRYRSRRAPTRENNHLVQGILDFWLVTGSAELGRRRNVAFKQTWH